MAGMVCDMLKGRAAHKSIFGGSLRNPVAGDGAVPADF
jgi:hypothetical protein